MNEKISGLLDPKMWEMSEEAKALARQHLQNEEERRKTKEPGPIEKALKDMPQQMVAFVPEQTEDGTEWHAFDAKELNNKINKTTMAEEIKYGLVRPENGRKMLETAESIDNMMELISGQMDVGKREMTRRANKVLYDLAEQAGKSLWSLCYEVAPHWKPVNSGFEPHKDGANVNMTVDYELELIPLQIDWQHDEGYFEKKYHDLKERVKGLIDDAEEEPKEGTFKPVVLARGHHIRNDDGTVTDVSDDPKYECQE